MPSFTAKEPSKEKNNEVNITAGDPKCYIYFDSEFTELKKDTDLISIGLVDYEGNTFYAEFTDYRKELIENTKWFKEFIFKSLSHPDTVLEGKNWTITGTKEEVQKQLLFWLDERCKDHIIQFVSDVCHYDFVLLQDLISGGKGALTIPENMISPTCVDINMDIATSINSDYVEEQSNFVPARLAFDISREDLAKQLDPTLEKHLEELPVTEKHNALFDAVIIKTIHQKLWDLA